MKLFWGFILICLLTACGKGFHASKGTADLSSMSSQDLSSLMKNYQGVHLSFTTGTQSVPANSCSQKVDIQLQTSLGKPLYFSGMATVALSATGIAFYADANCSDPITLMTLTGSTASGSFYFSGSNATATNVTANLLQILTASQGETIVAAVAGTPQPVPSPSPAPPPAPTPAPAPTPPVAAFLDSYSGATWGFSTHKLKSAFTGTWGTIVRQSDGAAMPIGFLSDGTADVASAKAFCTNTNCYVSSLTDQVNGLNATQAAFAKMPRLLVNSKNNLAVCPQPGSSMSTPYSPLVNTPVVHLFAVVRAAYLDNRPSQPEVPFCSVTGTVTKDSAQLTGLSSLVGISNANGGNSPGLPGVTDALGYLPAGTYLSSLGGNSISLAFNPGNLSPTGSSAADVFQVTNSVLGGAWIVNGPASSDYRSTAYWGVGMGADGAAGDWNAPRNGTIGYLSTYQSVFGQGMRGEWSVYDYDTYTTQLNYDSVSLGQMVSSSANITYKTNTGMTLFSDPSGSESVSQSCFETMVLFPQTETARVAMAQNLMSQDAIAFPFAPKTSDGFAWTGQYTPSFSSAADSVFGQYTIGPDSHGMSWNQQGGGYVWPSVAFANNISNGATMWRFVVQQGDSDINITGAERAEINATSTVAPGQHFSVFYQLQFEKYTDQSGDWCATGQIHYNNSTSGANTPDIIYIDCHGGKMQFLTAKTSGGGPAETNCGAPLTITPGMNYAVEIEGYWSTNHTSDTLTIHAGPNGSALPVVCSVGPSALWDNDSGAYLKAGVYRGYPWSNNGTVIERVMNAQISATQNAFASYISSQPPLPAHN